VTSKILVDRVEMRAGDVDTIASATFRRARLATETAAARSLYRYLIVIDFEHISIILVLSFIKQLSVWLFIVILAVLNLRGE
jgi:hypothetical protein